MTVVICTNEHDLHWVFDSRVANYARANPDTPPGTYWAIAAALPGERLDLIYFYEVGKTAPTYVDPHWLGILAYLQLEIDLTCDRPPAPMGDQMPILPTSSPETCDLDYLFRA
jgi:hypothetical protein